jgi:hypothetical protein
MKPRTLTLTLSLPRERGLRWKVKFELVPDELPALQARFAGTAKTHRLVERDGRLLERRGVEDDALVALIAGPVDRRLRKPPPEATTLVLRRDVEATKACCPRARFERGQQRTIPR